MISLAFGISAILLYALATILIGKGLAAGDRESVTSRLAAALAVGCHIAALIDPLWQDGALNLAFDVALSLIALLVSALVVVVSLIRQMDALGLGVFPLAAICVLLQLALPGTPVLATPDWTVKLHIALSVLSFSVLSLACMHALILAFQQQRLRSHRPAGAVSQLPPLQTMESLLFQLLTVGVVLLTLALITGVMFVENLFDQRLTHKAVLAIAAWLVFSVLLWGRWQFGWRGRTALRWILTGMAFLVLAYFGSKFVIEMLLGGA